MSLQRFQLDVAARLQAAPFFATVPIFVFRPRAAMSAAEIQERINAALGALTGQNSKAGLCATVLMPLVTTRQQELPGPYLHLECTVRVQENVLINMGANGTQIASEDAAIAVAQTLHLWTPGGTAGVLRAASKAITPNHSSDGKVTYDVQIESELDLACEPVTAQPFITTGDGAVSIACSDESAALYYTTDGTAPWPGNASYPSTAAPYNAPFAAPPSGTLLRAAAFAPGIQGSDITFYQF